MRRASGSGLKWRLPQVPHVDECPRRATPYGDTTIKIIIIIEFIRIFIITIMMALAEDPGRVVLRLPLVRVRMERVAFPVARNRQKPPPLRRLEQVAVTDAATAADAIPWQAALLATDPIP
jgi:hypothetical protein